MSMIYEILSRQPDAVDQITDSKLQMDWNHIIKASPPKVSTSTMAQVAAICIYDANIGMSIMSASQYDTFSRIVSGACATLATINKKTPAHLSITAIASAHTV